MSGDFTAADAITLAEINRKLDAALGRLDKIADDHESRLRSVERWVYAIPPTLLLATASVVAAVVTSGAT